MSSHLPDSNDAPRAHPARIAILSDVHGNLPAFGRCSTTCGRAGVDAIWCLGDLVGYGASPDECVALAQAECDIVLGGNHDLAVAGRIELADFSPAAAAAARWTREHASAETLALLETLDARPARTSAIGLYHGSPRRPDLGVRAVDRAGRPVARRDDAARRRDRPHPRRAALHSPRRRGYGEQTPGGTEHDLPEGEWLINPGSVGQPRDRDPRAAWMLLDLERWTASWRRVEYPIDEAAKAIAAADLPRHLADRLFIGQ